MQPRATMYVLVTDPSCNLANATQKVNKHIIIIIIIIIITIIIYKT